MPIFTDQIPLSLYVHIPWCVRKCPYCDFNSHAAKDNLPEALYVNALLDELDHYLPLVAGRPLVSIFFGGGTPSLFSGDAIARILAGVKKRMPLAPPLEITLEANPGTIDHVRFKEFREAGINRLSLGVQSFQDDKLKTLGRIHDSETAIRAIQVAMASGFNNFNIDLMYGLPNQSIEDALHDLKTALQLSPSHLSWYQLTIEPNTLFYRQTPVLPEDETLWEMQLAGQALLATSGFQQYEVSAYARNYQTCRHNTNYWEFGDYLGIGAGAHSKVTDLKTGHVSRFSQVKHPKDYLEVSKRNQRSMTLLTEADLMFEFMLNALRLTNGIPTSLFSARTGLPLKCIQTLLLTAQDRGLLIKDDTRICPTDLGKRFLNDLVTLFLVDVTRDH